MSQPDDENTMLLVYEMTQIVTAELGLRERFAVQFAEALVGGMRQRLAGVRIPGPDRAQRNKALAAEFDGRNVEQLAVRHGVSRATVYRALKKTSYDTDM